MAWWQSSRAGIWNASIFCYAIQFRLSHEGISAYRKYIPILIPINCASFFPILALASSLSSWLPGVFLSGLSTRSLIFDSRFWYLTHLLYLILTVRDSYLFFKKYTTCRRCFRDADRDLDPLPANSDPSASSQRYHKQSQKLIRLNMP